MKYVTALALTLFFLVPTIAHAVETNPPLIFLPGIFGSRLYSVDSSGNTKKIWDGLAGERMREILMDEEGKSIKDIRVGGMIDYFSIRGFSFQDIYGSLQSYFGCFDPTISGTVVPQSYALINLDNIPGSRGDHSCDTPFVSYPYDWRYDVFDIVDNGTTYTSGEHVNLIDLIEELADNETGKVNILAHSNGGLLAKALMIRLEEIGKSDLVDTIITVGSPQLGTPKAVAAMLHGYEQSLLNGLIKRESISRLLSLNSPGAYNLLPSEEYIKNNDPVIYFDSTTAVQKYRNIFGESIDSYTEFFNFLTNKLGLRTQPKENNLRNPVILRKNLLLRSIQTHKKLDTWVPQGDTRFVQIVGVGNSTEVGFEYTSKSIENKNGPFALTLFSEKVPFLKPKFGLYGDSEVVDSSAGLEAGERYYFNFKKLLIDTDRVREHKNFFVELEVLDSIQEIFKRSEPTSSFIKLERPQLTIENKLVVSVHSPVLISVKNSSNQVTSITYDTGSDTFETIIEIPGSSVQIIDEGKYIILPEGNYEVTITGLGTGSFDLVLSEIDNEGSLQELERFSHIPTLENSVGLTSIIAGSLSALTLDLDNDSSNDFTFSSEGSNISEITNFLKVSISNLPLNPLLQSAVDQYFVLIEETGNDSDRINYVAQIKRIIRFLNGRYIDQEEADELTALVDYLK